MKIASLLRRAALCLLPILSAPALADPNLWIGDEAGRLARVDVATGTVTLVGRMGVTMADIAFDPFGGLWGVSYDSALFRIDTRTGAATVVGGLGTVGVNSLVFAADGTLYGASNRLFTIDTTQGKATPVGNTTLAYTSSGDLAFVGGQLLLAGNGHPSDQLLRLDLQTGSGQLIGALGVDAVFGLAAAGPQALYAVARTRIYGVDPATGRSWLLSDYAGQGLSNAYGTAFLGESVSPVSEPAPAGLLALGLLGVALNGRRRGGRDQRSPLR